MRQDDPLPFLFCLAQDFLSRYLTHLVDSGSLLLIFFHIGMSAPTHFLYVDDVLLLCRASPQNLPVILNAFEFYGSLSSQHVSWEKFSIYFSMAILEAKITDFFPLRV